MKSFRGRSRRFFLRISVGSLFIGWGRGGSGGIGGLGSGRGGGRGGFGSGIGFGIGGFRTDKKCLSRTRIVSSYSSVTKQVTNYHARERRLVAAARDFLITCLRKICIPCANRRKSCGRDRADDFVSICAKFSADILRLSAGYPALVSMWCHCNSCRRMIPSKNPPSPSPNSIPADTGNFRSS